MKKREVKTTEGPEQKIQKAVIAALTLKGWTVKSTHGNMFQSGFPDLYCMHPRYGTRWIECKNPVAYSFTKAQMEWFPKFAAAQVGIWILTSAVESELDKLFKPPNWHTFLWRSM